MTPSWEVSSSAPSPEDRSQQFSWESRKHTEAENMSSRGKPCLKSMEKVGSQHEINESIAERERGSRNTKSVFHRLP